jgi:fatty acid desaturase
MAVVAAPVRGSDFSVLCREVRAAGLLDRRYGYYAIRAVLLVAALAGTVTAIVVIGDTWWQALIAVALAVVLTQIAFLGHDAGHQQIFRRRRHNDAAGLIAGNLLVGLSYGWWVAEHTRHHVNPNHEEHDPDIAESVLAFTPGQVAERRGLLRFIAKHEAGLFFPLLTLEGLNLHVSAVQHLWGGKRVRYPRLERTLLVAHVAAMAALPFLVMPVGKAVAFLAITQAVFGVYMGCSFAPNHKGMPTIPAGVQLDFLRRQVLTARNISGGSFVDVLMGGLNYQIEHHLFPNMPSTALRRARPLVKRHCARLRLPYTETTLFDSYRIALTHLHDIGAEVRGRDKATALT